MAQLRFSRKQQIVAELLYSPHKKDITEIFYGGAAGGGKTYLIAHFQIDRRLRYRRTRGFIGRESLKNLKLTTFKTFCDVWDEFYRDNPWGVSWTINWQTNVINFTNGSEIVLMDLGHYPSDPEYHRLGSLEITDACIDELPEIKEKAFEILMSRIRYKLDTVGGSPKCLATGNPANNWVKNRYVKADDGEDVILKPHQRYIRATVHDNPNETFKKTYIAALKKLSPADKARLLDGSWDIMLNENPWAWALNRDKHYSSEVLEVNKNYPLIVSFDFNHDPCVCVIAQYEAHKPQYNILAYYKASSSHESAIKQLCDRIRTAYPHHWMTKQMIVTGDASGKARDANRPANENRYSDIAAYLGIGMSAINIERSNASHRASRDLCNDILHQLPKGCYTFYGGQGCEMLLTEIESAYPDQKESLNKAKAELGLHGLDAWRYLNFYMFCEEGFKTYQRVIDSCVYRLKK